MLSLIPICISFKIICAQSSTWVNNLFYDTFRDHDGIEEAEKVVSVTMIPVNQGPDIPSTLTLKSGKVNKK